MRLDFDVEPATGKLPKTGVMSGLATSLPGLQFKVEPVATNTSACGCRSEDPYEQADRRTLADFSGPSRKCVLQVAATELVYYLHC